LIPLRVDRDQGLFYLINDVWTAPVLDWLMPTLSRAGNFGAVWLVLLGVIAIFGKRAGRTVALAGLFALVLGHVVSDVLKLLTVRPRPFVSLPDVRSLVAGPRSYAFPSGHAASAFSVATGVVLAAKRSLNRVPLPGWAMLVLAVAISYSRVYVGVHYPTDVLAGAGLGVACGWIGARCVVGRKRAREAGRSRENGQHV
jgi:undecaprenyl-diphosphatase